MPEVKRLVFRASVVTMELDIHYEVLHIMIRLGGATMPRRSDRQILDVFNDIARMFYALSSGCQAAEATREKV